MKTTIIILSAFFFTLLSCEKHSKYEAEEIRALEDISNDYLIKEDLSKIINLPDSMLGREVYKPNLDSLDIKVYLSDALLPIAQEKEDNLWMFKDNNFSNQDSIVFYKIVNSKKFQELNYREFNKRKIILKKPYHQSNYSEIKAHADKPYKILKFSRICFDEKMENGIVVVEMLEGLEYGTMSGFNGAILIKKKNNHWEYIPQE